MANDCAGVTHARLLADEYWRWRLEDSPEFATLMGCHDYDHLLDCHTLEHYQKRKETCQSFLRRVLELQDTDLCEDDAVNMIILREELETYLHGYDFKGYCKPVLRNEDIRCNLDRVVNNMNYRNGEDYDKLFSRLEQFPQQVESFITLMRHGIQEGVVPHVIAMDIAVTSLQQLLLQSPEATSFYRPFLQLNDLKTIPSERKCEIGRKGAQMIKNEILGSFQKLLAFLQEEYIPNVTSDIACVSLRRGKALYQACLKFHLNYDLTPQEVHDIGLQEVERIKANMQKVMKEVGFDGNIAEFFEFMRTSKQFYYDTKEDLLNGFRDIMERIRRELPRYFRNIPKVELRVQDITYNSKNANYAHYIGPSLDGKKPGTVFVNCYNPESRPKYEMMAIALHETEPGHHLQFSYSYSMDNWPGYRRCKDERQYCITPSRFPHHCAYIEGWGMYCEFLGEEMGMYDDPYALFGRYSQEMQRACRLVVDTGIHAFGWSVERAADYMHQNMPMARELIIIQIHRFIASPGQACAYTIGLMKIKELRQRAQDRLGDKFDSKDFHDAVLSCGMVPLTVLELLIDKYIEKSVKTE